MKLRTNPRHILDSLLWPVLRRLFLKQSCPWQWIQWTDAPRRYLTIAGDPDTKRKPADERTIVIMYPVLAEYDDTGDDWLHGGEYRIGFKAANGAVKLCTVIVPSIGRDIRPPTCREVAVEVRGEDVMFFAEAANGKPALRLVFGERSPRYSLQHHRNREVMLL
jgi:hypothetical protein